ncbi:MAG: hypothetical protein AAF658_02320, partial [Myxococcota bacterium]
LAGIQPARGLSTDQAQRISATALRQGAQVEALGEAGVQVDPASTGTLGLVTIAEDTTLQGLAASAFGVEPDEVGTLHYQLLLGTNGDRIALDEDDRGASSIEAGSVLDLSASPLVADIQITEMQSALQALESAIRFADDPPMAQEELEQLTVMRSHLQTRLADLTSSRDATEMLLQVASAQQRSQQFVREGNVEGVTEAFGSIDDAIGQILASRPADSPLRAKLEGVRSQLALSRATMLEGAAQTLLAEHNEGAAAREAIAAARRDYQAVERAAGENAGTIFAMRQVALAQMELRSWAASPELIKIRSDGGARKYNDLSSTERASFDRQRRGLQDSARRLERAIAAVETDDPELASALQRQQRLVQSQRRQTEASLYAMIGDPGGSLRLLHDDFRSFTGLGPSGIATDHERTIDDDSERLTGFWSWFSGTDVGFISRRKLNRIGSTLMGLPEQDRAEALRLLSRIGGTHADMGNIDGTNGVRQILGDMAARTGDEALRVESIFIGANFQQQVGDYDGAARSLLDAYQRTQSLEDPGQRERLGGQAAMAYAGSLATLASAGDSKREREQAALDLRTFRRQLEQGGPLSRERLGQLLLMEANTFLSVNRGGDARSAMQDMGAYREIPAVDAAWKSFYESNDKGNVEAAVKVALRELNNESLGEALGFGLGGAAAGAAAGAAIGVWFFGVGALAGAGIGAIVGGALGTATIKGVNLYRGWDTIEQAADSGLTQLTLGDSVMDLAFLSLDVVAVVLPLKGAGGLAKEGGKSLLRGAGRGMADEALTQTQRNMRGRMDDILTTVTREGAEMSDGAVRALATRLGLRNGDGFVRNVADELARLQRAGLPTDAYLEQAVKTSLVKRMAERSIDFSNKYARGALAVGGVSALGVAMAPMADEGLAAYASGDHARIEAWKRNMKTMLVTFAVMGGTAMTANHLASNPRTSSRQMRRMLAEAEADAAAVVARMEADFTGASVPVMGVALAGAGELVDGVSGRSRAAPDGAALEGPPVDGPVVRPGEEIEGAVNRTGSEDVDGAPARAEAEVTSERWLDGLDAQDQVAGRMLLGAMDGAAQFEPQHFDTMVRLVRRGIDPQTALGLSEPAAAHINTHLNDIYASPVQLQHDGGWVTFSDGRRSRMSQEQLTSPAQRAWDAFESMVEDPVVLDRVRADLSPSIPKNRWRTLLTNGGDTVEGQQFLADHKRSRFAKGALQSMRGALDADFTEGLTVDQAVTAYRSGWDSLRTRFASSGVDLPDEPPSLAGGFPASLDELEAMAAADLSQAYGSRWAVLSQRFNDGNSLARRQGATLDGDPPGLGGTPPRTLDDLYGRIHNTTFSV